MKKFISSITILPVLFLFISLSAHAANITPYEAEITGATVVYLEDGGRIVISPVYETDSCSPVGMAANTITRSRDIFREDTNGNLEWSYTLTATFSYEYGVSSTCIDADYSKAIYDIHWSFSDGSATRSGSTAYGKGTFLQKELFLVLQTIDVDISLFCDVYGNVT